MRFIIMALALMAMFSTASDTECDENAPTVDHASVVCTGAVGSGDSCSITADSTYDCDGLQVICLIDEDGAQYVPVGSCSQEASSDIACDENAPTVDHASVDCTGAVGSGDSCSITADSTYDCGGFDVICLIDEDGARYVPTGLCTQEASTDIACDENAPIVDHASVDCSGAVGNGDSCSITGDSTYYCGGFDVICLIDEDGAQYVPVGSCSKASADDYWEYGAVGESWCNAFNKELQWRECKDFAKTIFDTELNREWNVNDYPSGCYVYHNGIDEPTIWYNTNEQKTTGHSMATTVCRKDVRQFGRGKTGSQNCASINLIPLNLYECKNYNTVRLKSEVAITEQEDAGYPTGCYLYHDNLYFNAHVSGAAKEETDLICVKGTCSDGVQNQGEEGVDCGGPCKDCINMDTFFKWDHTLGTRKCDGESLTQKICRLYASKQDDDFMTENEEAYPPGCYNYRKRDGTVETVVYNKHSTGGNDHFAQPICLKNPCIGVTCPGPTSACRKSPGTCVEGTCWYLPKEHGESCGTSGTVGTCDALGSCSSCSDGIQNGLETSVDCGGTVCDACLGNTVEKYTGLKQKTNCPTLGLFESNCKKYASQTSNTFTTETEASKPKGCYELNNGSGGTSIFFNKHSTGAAQTDHSPICLKATDPVNVAFYRNCREHLELEVAKCEKYATDADPRKEFEIIENDTYWNKGCQSMKKYDTVKFNVHSTGARRTDTDWFKLCHPAKASDFELEDSRKPCKDDERFVGMEECRIAAKGNGLSFEKIHKKNREYGCVKRTCYPEYSWAVAFNTNRNGRALDKAHCQQEIRYCWKKNE